MLEIERISSSGVLSDSELKDLVDRFENFIIRNKLCINDFCDNVDIYISYSQFSELFKKIRFEISKIELATVFLYNNPSQEEGHILVKNFLENFKFSWKEEHIETTNTEYNIKKINKEFKELQSEIYDIVKQDMFNSIFSKPKRISSTAKIKKPVMLTSNQIITNNQAYMANASKINSSQVPYNNSKQYSYANSSVKLDDITHLENKY